MKLFIHVDEVVMDIAFDLIPIEKISDGKTHPIGAQLYEKLKSYIKIKAIAALPAVLCLDKVSPYVPTIAPTITNETKVPAAPAINKVFLPNLSIAKIAGIVERQLTIP